MARREGCGSQRPGLQPVAESAGTLNYIDQSVFLPRSAETGPVRSWDLPSPPCSRELTTEGRKERREGHSR